MKIVFFGTANEALPILETLNNAYQILAVVTTPDVLVGRKQTLEESPVSALANDLKLPLFKPENIKANQQFVDELKKLDADIYVVVAYGKILPAEIINIPKYKAVNVHFAILPKYRGPSPIQTALLNGDEQTGTSIFVLNEKIDQGGLLAQEIVNIEPDDNYFTLSDKLAKRSAKIILPTLENYTSGKLTPLPQHEAQASQSKIIAKDDGRINWHMTAQEIYNQFRAYYIWPGIWTTWKGQTIKITDCAPTELQRGDTTDDYRIGTVLNSEIISCGNKTALRINRLQLAGKKEMPLSEFLNGYKDFVGSVLE